MHPWEGGGGLRAGPVARGTMTPERRDRGLRLAPLHRVALGKRSRGYLDLKAAFAVGKAPTANPEEPGGGWRGGRQKS